MATPYSRIDREYDQSFNIGAGLLVVCVCVFMHTHVVCNRFIMCIFCMFFCLACLSVYISLLLCEKLLTIETEMKSCSYKLSVRVFIVVCVDSCILINKIIHVCMYVCMCVCFSFRNS